MEDKTFIHRLQGAEGFFLLSLHKENHFTLHLVKGGFVRNLHLSQSDKEELQNLQKNGNLLGFAFDKNNQLFLQLSSSLEEDATIKELLRINPFAHFSINEDVFHSFGITPVEAKIEVEVDSFENSPPAMFEKFWKEAIIEGELERMEKKKNPPKM